MLLLQERRKPMKSSKREKATAVVTALTTIQWMTTKMTETGERRELRCQDVSGCSGRMQTQSSSVLYWYREIALVELHHLVSRMP